MRRSVLIVLFLSICALLAVPSQAVLVDVDGGAAVEWMEPVEPGGAGGLCQERQDSASPEDQVEGQVARSGCCSHHQGVCGCRSGRAICCDGAASPSCGC